MPRVSAAQIVLPDGGPVPNEPDSHQNCDSRGANQVTFTVLAR